MDNKELLRNMVDSMINDDQLNAEDNFKEYLKDKMQGIINPQVDVETDDVETDDVETDDVEATED